MAKQVNKEATIKTFYTELNKFGQNSQFDKALKSVNKILGITPNDEKALHCKVICLIQLLRFNEALQVISKNNLNDLVFERAYCEYRLNEPKKALEIIDSNNSPLSLNLRELRAQILYKLEKYDEASEAYKNIIKDTHDDYEEERRTNLSAAESNLLQKESSAYEENNYETCFNNACALLNKNKFNEAQNKLRTCEKICRGNLEEDGATQEEIEEELAVIRIQLAYCLQMQGNVKDAAAIYSEYLKRKSKDSALVAIASNNSVVLNGDQNVFDSKKKMRLALNEINEHKLTSKHKKAIALNNCLLSLYINSIDQCFELCNKYIKDYPDNEFEFSLVKCAALSKNKKYNEAIETLENLKTDEHKVAVKFAITQLHLLNGNKKAAIETLHSLDDFKYKPGVISALVVLYLSLDKKAAASDILKSAVEWYKKNEINSGDLSDMWHHAADFHLRAGAAETAASSLEELFKLNRQNMKVLAQLVIAYAQFDPKKAQEASKKLPALKTMTTAAEIDVLEAANWIMAAKAVKKTAKYEQSPGSDAQKCKVKPKRKRKGQLPKNFNPAIPPDPERWLPKYERSTYKKKRDRRSKDVIKGSQGTTSHTADQYDMSKNITKSSPSTYQESTPTPRHQHKKGIQKKKKGRH